MERFGHTQERLAEALGKSRSHIANLLRLLTLPEPVLELLRAGKLTAGHARALVTASNPEALARQVVERDLSVRQTEALARSAPPSAPPRTPRRTTRRDQGCRHPRARGGPDGHAATEGHASTTVRASNRARSASRYGNLEELDGALPAPLALTRQSALSRQALGAPRLAPADLRLSVRSRVPHAPRPVRGR